MTQEEIWALDNDALLQLILTQLTKLHPRMKIGQAMKTPVDYIDGEALVAKTYRVRVKDIAEGTFSLPYLPNPVRIIYPYTTHWALQISAEDSRPPLLREGSIETVFSPTDFVTKTQRALTQEQADQLNVIFFRCAIL